MRPDLRRSGAILCILSLVCISFVGIAAAETTPAAVFIPPGYVPTFNITDLDTPIESCLIRVDDGNTLHILWQTEGELYFTVGTVDNTGRVIHMTDNYGDVTDPAMAVTSDGINHFAWAAPKSSKATWDLLYVRNEFDAAQWITSDGSTNLDRSPGIAAQGDTVCIAWERNGGADVVFTSFTNHHQVPAPTVIASSQESALRMRLVEEHPEGGFAVYWADTAGVSGDDLYLTTVRNGAVVSSECVRRSPGRISDLDMAPDDDGRMHLVWQEDIGDSSIIMYASGRLGGGFNPVSVICSSGTAHSPGVMPWGGHSVYITWQNRETGEVMLSTYSPYSPPVTELLLASHVQADQSHLRRRLRVVADPDGDYLMPIFLSPVGGVRNVSVAHKVLETNNPVMMRVAEPELLAGAVKLSWNVLTDGIAVANGITDFIITRRNDCETEQIAVLPVRPAESASGTPYTVIDRPTSPATYTYVLEARTSSGAVVYTHQMDVVVCAPQELTLSAAPNPFNGVVSITVQVPSAGGGILEIRDITGRLVAEHHLPGNAGTHTVSWDGRDTAGRETGSGVYLVRCILPERDGYPAAVRTARVTYLK